MRINRNYVLQWLKTKTKLLIVLIAGLVVGGTSTAAVLASIPDGNNVYHACYRTSNGSLRIIDNSTQTCSGNESPIFWNQTGPAGADGQDGQPGEQGPPGPSGPGGFVSNLVGANFNYASLQYREMSNLDLHNSKFDGAYLTGGNFAGSNLSGTTGIREIEFANFQGADFTGTVFVWALRANGANFQGANFTNATLAGGYQAPGPSGSGQSDLTNANLQQANFTGTVFTFAGSNENAHFFTGGDFSNAQFVNATMNGIVFQGSPIFTGATWANTICPDGTNSDNNGNTCLGHGL